MNKIIASSLFYFGFLEVLILVISVVGGFINGVKEISDGIAWMLSLILLLILAGVTLFSFLAMKGRFHGISKSLSYTLLGVLALIELSPLLYLLIIVYLCMFYN